MLGMVHTAMLLVAGSLCFWLSINRKWLAVFAVAISQLPFWGGYVASLVGDYHPLTFNMFADMAVSAVFVWLAYRFDEGWLIWLGVIFLCVLIVDIYAMSFGMNFYLELHEFFHYAALVLIAWRGVVVGVDRHIRGFISSVQN